MCVWGGGGGGRLYSHKKRGEDLVMLMGGGGNAIELVLMQDILIFSKTEGVCATSFNPFKRGGI